MKRLRILHITPWFPTKEQPSNAVWIRRHIDCLQDHVDQFVYHLDVEFGSWHYSCHSTPYGRSCRIRFPWKIWRLREWVFFVVLMAYLMRAGVKRKFDAVNFHIAYPACVHLRTLSRWLPRRKVITEHWSYYHFHFHSQKPLERVKRIFSNGIPVFAVSEALVRDIENFSGFRFPYFIVPNAVNRDVFHPQNLDRGEHLLMAAFWKAPKNPFPVFHAISILKEQGRIIRLRIAGFGPLWDQLRSQVHMLGLDDQVEFIGELSGKELATEFNRAAAFILPSEYETFSVVCAEALCCGCPVLSEPIGALPELVQGGNGLLREEEETWSNLLQRYVNHAPFDRDAIALRAASQFDYHSVGSLYYQSLSQL